MFMARMNLQTSEKLKQQVTISIVLAISVIYRLIMFYHVLDRLLKSHLITQPITKIKNESPT